MGDPQIHSSIMNFRIIYPRRSHIQYGMGYHWFWTIPTWPKDICVKWSLPLIDIGSWKLPQPQNPTDFTEGTSNIGFVYNLYIPIHYEQTRNNILLLILATLTHYTYIYSTYSLPHQAVDEMTSVSHLPPSLHIFATCMVVIMSSQCYLPLLTAWTMIGRSLFQCLP